MTPIAQVSSRNKLQPKRPSMLDALGEFRVPLEASIYWLGALAHPWPHVKPDNAKVVMLIPGFMAGDMTLAPLANFCRWLGHRAVYAGILSNSECPRETMRKLNARLALAYEKFDQPIVIVGQSLVLFHWARLSGCRAAMPTSQWKRWPSRLPQFAEGPKDASASRVSAD
jgi:hypothetical protein